MPTMKRKNRNKRTRKHKKQPSVLGKQFGRTPHKEVVRVRQDQRKLALKRQVNRAHKKSLKAAG